MFNYKDTSGTEWVYNSERGLFEGTSLAGRVAYISPKVLKEGYAAKLAHNKPITQVEKAMMQYINLQGL